MNEQGNMSWNAVRALRAYSAALPPAVKSLRDKCDAMKAFCNSMGDRLGSLRESYLSMIQAVEKFLEDATDPILVLSQDLENKANEIQMYLVSGGNPT